MKRKNLLLRWIDYTSEIGGQIGAVFMIGVTLIIVFEVLMRYLFNSPTTWVGETSIYFSMAIGFLALAYTFKSDGHFSITLLVDRLTPKNRCRLKVFTDFVGFLYSATFIFKGYEMAKFAYDIEDVSSGMMQMPLWIPWSLVPLGGFLLSLQFINKLVDDVTNLKQQ